MCRYFMIYLHIRVHVSSYNISLVISIKSKAEDSFCKAVVILHSTKSYLFHGPRISVASVATASEIHATDVITECCGYWVRFQHM